MLYGDDHVRYAEACAQAGGGRFPHAQAADTAEALADSLGEVSDLATKVDLAELKAELKPEMAELRTELKTEMAELRAEIRGELNTHLRWIVGTIIAVAARRRRIETAAVVRTA